MGLSITFTDGEVSVSVLPKNHVDDKGLKSLRPLSLRASVDEMESKFFEAVIGAYKDHVRQRGGL